MDLLSIELAKLQKDGNLKQSIEDVDKIIEQLERARETIVAGKDEVPNIPKWRSEAWDTLEHLLIPARSKLCLHNSCEATKSAETELRQSER